MAWYRQWRMLRAASLWFAVTVATGAVGSECECVPTPEGRAYGPAGDPAPNGDGRWDGGDATSGGDDTPPTGWAPDCSFIGCLPDCHGRCGGSDGCTGTCPDDCGLDAYTWRMPVTVTAGAATVPAYHTIAVTFDHASLVSGSGARVDGNDLRVIYHDGARYTELDRILESGSSWDANDTTVLFRVQRDIAPAASDTYYLYYDASAAGSPPEDPRHVYYYFEDFSSGLLDDWVQWDLNGAVTWIVDGSTERLRNEINRDQNDITPWIASKLVLAARPPARDMRVRYRYRARDNDLAAVGLCSCDDSPAGFYVGQTTHDRWFDVKDFAESRLGYWKSDADNAFVAASFSEDVWYEMVIDWSSASTSVAPTPGDPQSWGSGPDVTTHRFCIAINGMSGVDFDDLEITTVVEPPPAVALGAEESAP